MRVEGSAPVVSPVLPLLLQYQILFPFHLGKANRHGRISFLYIPTDFHHLGEYRWNTENDITYIFFEVWSLGLVNCIIFTSRLVRVCSSSIPFPQWLININ
jgi:hypothetical protein